MKAYRASNRDKIREQRRVYHKGRVNSGVYHAKKALVDPKKVKAHRMVRRVVGYYPSLEPLVCSVCGDDDRRIVGHHEDYSKPLCVVWVCDICHSAIHHNRVDGSTLTVVDLSMYDD